MSHHGESRGKKSHSTIRAEPALRGIMSRLAIIGLTALETWSSSDIPTADQVETGRDIFKCILDQLAWESQKRDWDVVGPEADDVSRETDEVLDEETGEEL